VQVPAACSAVKVCGVGGFVPGPWETSFAHAALTVVFHAVRMPGEAAAHAAAVGWLLGRPCAEFADVTPARAPAAWLSSCARVAASPAANLVHVAVCSTPSSRLTRYVPFGNPVIVGEADPATRVAVPPAPATQEGCVKPGLVSPYEPREKKVYV
jgi:hypothetical protein